jgi:hypothetical protein
MLAFLLSPVLWAIIAYSIYRLVTLFDGVSARREAAE